MPEHKTVDPQLYQTISDLHKAGGISVEDSASSKLIARNSRRLTTHIYDILRQEIVSLARQPGSPINENQICTALNVSRTPVREAILKLKDEGLIEIFPQSGTRVAPISLSGLANLVFFRSALETQSIKDLVSTITVENIAALNDMIAQQYFHARHNDCDNFHLADERFHEFLLTTANRKIIWDKIDREKGDLDRFRRLTLPLLGQMLDVTQEHQNIVSAIEMRDADIAMTALRDHLGNVLSVVQLLKGRHQFVFS
ncbi:GntR family transcriptional regulator [Gluconobacter cerinus]|uniref:GntR family transcriptional regulator n=1 Tax=Gluconobacter cerinus TaxID=38307 RepID=UPI001B8CA26D|nr:GntR family transcriptional regulator [Gluconobacter cerinus]